MVRMDCFVARAAGDRTAFGEDKGAGVGVVSKVTALEIPLLGSSFNAEERLPMPVACVAPVGSLDSDTGEDAVFVRTRALFDGDDRGLDRRRILRAVPEPAAAESEYTGRGGRRK